MSEWVDKVLEGIRMLFQMELNRDFQSIMAISDTGGGRMFLDVLYRSMIAGGIVLIILLIRVMMRRAPKIYSYLLWGLVLYRLLCPFTLVSSFSVLGLFDTADAVRVQRIEGEIVSPVQTDLEEQEEQVVPAGMEISEAVQVDKGTVTLSRSGRVILWVATHVWLAGMALILVYGCGSLLWFRRRLKGAVKIRDNIYLSDYIPTPFVIGIIRPRIYLPSSLEEKEWEYIILHETTHIRRGDHIIRIISFITLAFYWFHPLVWAAYYLSGKDMEMSCDEAVMRKMKRDVRADYCTSLLNLSTGRMFMGGTPLAFGEGDTKKRIENVMCWHRPKPAAVVAAVTVLIIAGVVLGTDPMPTQAGEQRLRQAAETWAQAVCDRDGNGIVALSTEEKIQQLKSEELLGGEEGAYSFGWSSPWPWDAQQDYRIVECTPQDTIILYYAWTSEPHVTVWQEHLRWREEDGEYRVEESSVRFMDSISDGESFAAAYAEGISGTPIDYLTNGAGESLNANALRDRENYEYYQSLFAPETAVRMLLNISEEGSEVIVTVGDMAADGSVEVFIDFTGDSARASVKMVQPYGADGIWIPQ